MAAMGVCWSAFANLAVFLLKPFPFRVAPKVTNVDDILPQYRFIPMRGEENVAIVTGSNTGIGFETASSLVHHGYTVILACRSRDKGQAAVDKINNGIRARIDEIEKEPLNQPVGKAEFLHPLDLSSLQSVKSFTEAFHEKYAHLNILVNNAGINSTGKSVDNLDLCFQTNFVGHYLLTRLMLPKLLKAKNFSGKNKEDVEAGRVVNLSSVTHHWASCNEVRSDVNGVDYSNKTGKADAAWWKGTATPGVSDNTYKESKLAAVLLTHELNKRFKSQGLRAISVNPGGVNSDIWRNYPRWMDAIHRAIYLTPEQGSRPSVAAAISKLPEDAVYLQPYWQPFKNIRKRAQILMNPIELKQSFGSRWYSNRFPIQEMLGVCIGFAITKPTLPVDIDDSSKTLWEVCEELVGGIK